MTALAAGDVTVTVNKQLITNNRRRNQITLTFGDGAKTYPSGGVPIPADGVFGMKQALDFLDIIDAGNSGFEVRYDQTNKKIQLFQQGAVSPGNVTVVGSQAAGPALQITPDSAAGVLGKTTAGTVAIPAATFGFAASAAQALVELPTSATPTVTVTVEAVGW